MENLLERNVEKKYMENRGATVVSAIIGLVVAIIVIVAVGIPITQSVITTANITDATTKTVVGFIPLFMGLSAMVLTVSFLQ